MLTIEKVHAAKARLAPFIEKSPLIRAHSLESYLGGNCKIFLKCEQFNITRSFKLRSALSLLTSNIDLYKQRGLVTRSSGNFAQAISYAGSILNIPVTVVMPTTAPKIKVELTKRWGCNLIIHGNTHEQSEEKVKEIAESTGAIIGSPFNDYEVMAGGGTITLELLEDLVSIESFFCPIGGGGLLSGNAFALKQLSPQTRIYGVEPANANDYQLSRKTAVRKKILAKSTICDGLRTPMVGELCFPILNQNVDEVVTATEEAINESLSLIAKKIGLIVEPSAAITVAALLENNLQLSGNIICMISGGNVDSFQKN